MKTVTRVTTTLDEKGLRTKVTNFVVFKDRLKTIMIKLEESSFLRQKNKSEFLQVNSLIKNNISSATPVIIFSTWCEDKDELEATRLTREEVIKRAELLIEGANKLQRILDPMIF